MNIVASLSSGSECTLYALLSSIGYHSLRTEQLETSLSILAGEDVIVRMSTAELSDNINELVPCVTTTIANNRLIVKVRVRIKVRVSDSIHSNRILRVPL